MLLFVPETLYPAGRKLATPKDSGEVSYPVATDTGAGTWMEAALEVELRESIFTIKNFTVGFTAPAWEKKKITELIMIFSKPHHYINLNCITCLI